jgi:hypothetical protein
MKVYTKIVIDLETKCVVEAESFDYDGPVAECKGGSSSTTTVDYAYNRRMATIAERQEAMAEEYFKFWESEYKPMEKMQIEANKELIPMQTEFAKEQMGLGLEEMKAAKPMVSEYYKQALEGVNVDERVTQARADVGLAFKEGEEATRREAGRLGLDPDDPRYARMMGSRGLSQAKATAGAMTGARIEAEDESFKRLQSGMSTFRGGIPS